jgi:AdoMet-dependent heme synthase
MPTLSDPAVRTSRDSRSTPGKTFSSSTAAPGSGQAPNTPGFPRHPLQVTWEMTQACDWKAAPVRARSRARDHFSTAEAFHLVEEVAALHVPLLALTGGDPLLRPDLFPVIEFAAQRSVRTSLTLLPTPLLDAATIAELKASGLMRVGFWLHGSTAALDDAHWAVPGCHRRTLGAVASCHEVQLPVQINTMLSRRNFHDIDPMIELLTRLDVDLWNVFFFVPQSPEQASELLTADEHEQVFAKLYSASKVANFQIKTTEGQHFQRYLMQQRVRESRGRLTEADVLSRGAKGVNEGNGFVFINHTGEVYPSRFLPLSGGNVTTQPLAEVYCDSPLLVSLLDSSRLKGKCGRCQFRNVCGGSRARAYAMTGDLFAPDPCCAYEP